MAVNKKRLLKLADLLEADAKNKKGIKFDLGTIVSHSEPVIGADGWPRSWHVKGEKPTLDCKTAACAVGLAAISGAFKRQGFSYCVTKDKGIELVFGRSRGFGSAASKFFGLSAEESEFLFFPDSYDGEIIGARGERKVAKRIRDFVAGKFS